LIDCEHPDVRPSVVARAAPAFTNHKCRRNATEHGKAQRSDRAPARPGLGGLRRRAARAPASIDEHGGNIVYTTSGRAAIALALRAVGCKAGDRVLVPTYHCPTMIAPVVRLGAVPEFYPLTASGAPSMSFLARHGRGVRAMLVAHYFGFPQPLGQLRGFCDANGIAMIEDCAHAFFGVVDGRPVGAWGDVAIASATKFFPWSREAAS
jgi:selenocysteine lyase/cysteine desulfurase